MKMFKLSSLLAAVASLAAATALAAPVNKCIINGSVTYQQEPCPTGQVRKPPTVQELNAEEKKRREAAAAATPPKPTLAAPTEPAGTPEKIAPATRAATSRYQCDGRTYCSQMTSCAEAKFFLANCPGVKMDGDRDGIPCEEQWCGH
jgi:Excalibur calcium-binding domain